jgi:hypothetical protein
MIEYHLVNVTTDQQMGHGCVRQLWVAAGLSIDAVDIVLAKIPLGWAARLSRVMLPPAQVATLHLREGDARELAY